MKNFNLLDEAWIPVLYGDGRWERVGIRKALKDAQDIRGIAATNPMDRAGILRFLIAVLYWCNGNPSTHSDSANGDAFPADWFVRLDENADCFDLLASDKRFYQYRLPGDATKRKLSANYLVQEVPTGQNWWHFRHSTDMENGVCAACSAIGLLRLPMFATSGGRGKPPGINSKPPLYVIPLGKNLADTIRLSWRVVENIGVPAWVSPSALPPRDGEVPLLMGLTWVPRRVWLDDPDPSESRCISCGRRERLIRQTVFAPIGSVKEDEEGPGRIWRDPHVIYQQSRNGDTTSLHASDALGASDAAAGYWARIVSGVLGKQNQPGAAIPMDVIGSGRKNLRNVWVIGFSTVQNDKYLEAKEYIVHATAVPQAVELIERWEKEGKSLYKKVRPKYEKMPSRKHIEIPPMIDAIRPHVEGRVSENVEALLTGSPDAWDEAADEYRPMMRLLARSLSPGVTTSAVLRRNQIAIAAPNMRPKADTPKKQTRKKGAEA